MGRSDTQGTGFDYPQYEPSGTELPVLIAQTGPLSGQRWLIDHDVIVGRDPSSDVVIADRQVSRYHARFEVTESGVMLEDLGSKNGTFFNGDRVNEPVLLKDGDLIQVALIQHFMYLTSDATMPLETDVLLMDKPKKRLHLEPRSRRVWVNQKEVVPPLSAQQFRLLQTLDKNRGEVRPRQDLIEEVWGADEAVGVSDQAFDALVRRLRDRLLEIDPEHVYIVTVRGHGLRLDNPDR
jgi:pSer/pThr/pTyr-binding forkhead associated (FHA) protein